MHWLPRRVQGGVHGVTACVQGSANHLHETCELLELGLFAELINLLHQLECIVEVRAVQPGFDNGGKGQCNAISS